MGPNEILPPLTDTLDGLRTSYARHVRYSLGRAGETLAEEDHFRALGLALRDRLVERMLETEQRYAASGAKRLYYLSIEFLMGRSLGNNLGNLGLLETCRALARELGVDLTAIEELEPDAALGNGGLGRLAACFLDSLATLQMPGYGYGINYEHGLFRQRIDNGYQREQPDNWLGRGTPWTLERPDQACLVPLYGRIEHAVDRHGAYNPMWLDWELLIGVPHDMPVVGHGGRTVNVLRLFSARASMDLDFGKFSEGDYISAVEQKIASERVTKVLYPSDTVRSGQELRLTQEYFLVACAIRDIVRRFDAAHSDLSSLPTKVAIQLNDTHPALAIAELMRLLVDEKNLGWDQAWQLTEATFGYTNHTLLPEALEKWPITLVERLLPRHLQVIYEINHRFLQTVRTRWPGDDARAARMSLVEEGDTKRVRMAHLALVGSHSVNGVSRLHSRLLAGNLFSDFSELWPGRFNNKTNGVTQRRWLLWANPKLASLITSAIGDAWIRDLDKLKALEPFAEDAGFRARFRAIKHENKQRLATLIAETSGVQVMPDALFDVQAKRIHEYKRQLLHVMYVVHELLSLVEDGRAPAVPRVHVFAGKAAPGYRAAKLLIKLIHEVARAVNSEPATRDLLRVAFVPDYRVSVAERIIPAADLSEQISTAGKEASGTGNMKFALNGALTMGTLDGANIEILEEVGAANIFIFGLTAGQIADAVRDRSYDPREACRRSPAVNRVVQALVGDRFCRSEPGLFRPLEASLLDTGDEYFHLADFPSYIEAQERASQEYLEPEEWTRKAVLNVARMGAFSSDRTIREYARDIWGLAPVPE